MFKKRPSRSCYLISVLWYNSAESHGCLKVNLFVLIRDKYSFSFHFFTFCLCFTACDAGGSTETSLVCRPRRSWSLEASMAAFWLDPARKMSAISPCPSGNNWTYWAPPLSCGSWLYVRSGFIYFLISSVDCKCPWMQQRWKYLMNVWTERG